MSKEEKIKEIVEELKDGKENPTFIYPTFDGSDEEEFENDKLLTPSSCTLLFDYITQLQNNWNELKKLLKEQIDICDGCIDTLRSDLQEFHPRSCGKTYLQNEILKNKTAKRSFEITLDKMQELEQGKNE